MTGGWTPDPRAMERFMADGPAPSDEMPGDTGRPRRERRRRRGLRSGLARLAATLLHAVQPVPQTEQYAPRHRRRTH